MSIRKKSRRRLLILLGIVVVVAGGIAAALSIRESKREGAAYDARAAAFLHRERREFSPCLENFHRYFRYFPEVLDIEARLACAEVIAEMPDSHADQLAWGRGHARRIVDADPDHLAAQLALLDINTQQGSLSEALDTSRRILELDPRNIDVTVEHALLLRRLRSVDEALAFMERRAAEVPESWQLRSLLLELLHEAKPDDLDAHLAQASGESSDGGLVACLQVIATRLAGKGLEARAAALDLTSQLGEADPDRLRAVANQLSLLGAHPRALEVLSKVPPAERNHDEFRYLILESVRNGLAKRALQHGAEWDFEPVYLETDILGELALAAGRVDGGSVAFRDSLVERAAGSPRAKAWGRVLNADPLRQEPAPLHERLEAALAAIELDKQLPEAWFFAGVAFREAGEARLALRHLYKAAEMATTWADPARVAAEIMAAEGNLIQAQEAAQVLERRSSQVPPALAMLLAMSRPHPDQPEGPEVEPVDRLLALAKSAGLGATEIAPLALALVANKESKDKARNLIEGLLEGKHTARTLVTASAISRKLELDLSSRCIERALSLHGSSPQIAREAALVAADQGGEQDAQRAFDRARAASGTDGVDWLVSAARLRGALGDDKGAAKAWREVLTRDDANVTQLERALARLTPQSEDAVFVAATERLRLRTHDQCTAWRVHVCRQVLAGDTLDASEVAQVEDHLDYVVDVRPDDQVVRDLRLSLFLATNQGAKALAELGTLLRDDPGHVEHALRASELHLARGQPVEARSVLRSLLVALNQREVETTYDERTRIAAQLVRAGAIEDARAYLRRVGASEASQSELRLARAEALIGLGALDEADALLADLGTGTAAEQALVLRAGIARLQGRAEDETSYLDALGGMVREEPRRLRLRIQHYSRTRAIDLAEAEFKALADRDTLSDDELREHWGLLVRLGKAEQLENIDAPASLEGQAGAWAKERALLASLARSNELRALGASCVEDFSPSKELVADLQRLHEHASNSGVLEADALVELASRYPEHEELQLTVVNTLERLGQLESAMSVIDRLRARFPASPAVAEAEARLHDRVGDQLAARSAAKRWSSLEYERSVPARLFLAERSAPAEAVRLLDPLVLPALRAGSAKPMLVFGTAMIRLGRVEELRTSLEPLLDTTPMALRVWLTLARNTIAPGEASHARAMLGHKTLTTPEKLSTTALIETASAWLAVAQGEGDKGTEARRTGLRLLGLAEKRQDLTARNWSSIGLLWSAVGHSNEARQAYERALQADPNELLAGNNMAMMLLRAGKAREALEITTRVVAAHGTNPSLLDTHGQVAEASSDLPSAIKAYSLAIRLDRTATSTALRLVDAYVRAGERDKARSILEYVDRKMDTETLGEEDRERLEKLKQKVETE